MTIMHTILCVDDDKKMLTMLRLTFRSKGRTVLTAESGKEGLALLEENNIQLVISDFEMPGMDGDEFLTLVRIKYPKTIRFMVTGTSGTPSDLEASMPGLVHRHFSKPVDVREMKEAVRMALEEGELAQGRG
jgi:DNA-binding NtrC family response regulator